jgi:acyl-CoA hydrolase
MQEPRKREVRPAEPLTMYELVFPGDLNYYGTMFGGNVVALMDKCAAICVGRWCNRTPVTASIDAIQFGTPIRQGQIVEIHAEVLHVGTASCIVRVVVAAHDMHAGDRFFCCEGYFCMVGVDTHGRPVALPGIPVETEAERRNWEHGAEIREAMLKRRAQSRG